MQRNKLQDLADCVDVHIATWNPGDGVTRYRFIDKLAEPDSQYWNYDAASHPLFTAHGLHEATVWLLGYSSGKGLPRE